MPIFRLWTKQIAYKTYLIEAPDKLTALATPLEQLNKELADNTAIIWDERKVEDDLNNRRISNATAAQVKMLKAVQGI